MTGSVRIDRVDTAVYTFPTPEPEADGTLEWSSVTAVTVTLQAAGELGWGWTYSSPAAAGVVQDHLAGAVRGSDALAVTDGWQAMRRACRNFGTRGLVSQAISAVDIAWWDLKARLLRRPLADLFGRCRDAVPVYGSGGFTTLSDTELAEQVAWWAAAGCTSMKIKIGESWGTRVDRDLERVARLGELAGPGVELMVDANGGYSLGQARRVGRVLDELDVRWFEEPVSSDDRAGLGELRSALDCDVTAGEYASDEYEIGGLLPVVDCLQLDATRCGGYTGFLRGAALAAAQNRQVSGHCAPALHVPVCAAVPNLRHLEWFVDHARLEPILAAGTPAPVDGRLPATSRPGHGLTPDPAAERYRVS